MADPRTKREEHRLDRLSWPEVAPRVIRDPRLVLPAGALEQHGPHLPLGTNTFVAESVAGAVCSRLGILQAPAFPYGVNLPGASNFVGTAGLRRKTLHRALNELLADWEDHGFSEFIVVAAHRSEAHMDALLLALASASTTTVFDLYRIDVGDLVTSPDGPEHAGEIETSLLLHLDPARVAKERGDDAPPDGAAIRKYRTERSPTPLVARRGVIGYPSRAKAETGEAVFRRWVETLESALRR